MSDVARDPDVVSRLARAENERWHTIQPLTGEADDTVIEALGHLEWLCDIAYNEGGAHELGYDPLKVIRTALGVSDRQSLTKGENA